MLIIALLCYGSLLNILFTAHDQGQITKKTLHSQQEVIIIHKIISFAARPEHSN